MGEELRRGRDEGFQEFVSRMLELLGNRIPEEPRPIEQDPRMDASDGGQTTNNTEG
jgi:hypothetical protein